VFADSSGAVVIPPGDLEQVLAAARSIEADDARDRTEIARENGPKASASPTSTSAVAAASRAPRTASPGRNSVFDGMQA
jgi:hypothetical protein